jgi:hypothetical protein
LIAGDAAALPFASEAFDLVLASLMAGDLSDLSGFTRRRPAFSGGEVFGLFGLPSLLGRTDRQRTFPNPPTEGSGGFAIPRALTTGTPSSERLSETVAIEEPLLGDSSVLVVLRAVKR